MPTESQLAAKDIRIVVPAKLWALLEEVGRVMRASPKWCLGHVFMTIEHMAESDDIAALGFEYVKAAKQLRARREHEEEQARATDPDLTKLHRSDKTKSGFVGVYSNGKGYRAEGRDPVTRKGAVTLGTFPDAESAALARLKHYTRYGMPYGRIADLIEQYREREEALRTMSDERVKHEVIWSEATIIKRPIEGLTDEERALEHVNPYTGERC
jgi:hypothetical protein